MFYECIQNYPHFLTEFCNKITDPNRLNVLMNVSIIFRQNNLKHTHTHEGPWIVLSGHFVSLSFWKWKKCQVFYLFVQNENGANNSTLFVLLCVWKYDISWFIVDNLTKKIVTQWENRKEWMNCNFNLKLFEKIFIFVWKWIF